MLVTMELFDTDGTSSLGLANLTGLGQAELLTGIGLDGSSPGPRACDDVPAGPGRPGAAAQASQALGFMQSSRLLH